MSLAFTSAPALTSAPMVGSDPLATAFMSVVVPRVSARIRVRARG